MFTALLFVVGFAILIKGASILIDGASSVARLFRISDWVVGVVVVGIGTSIPEFAIMLASAFNGGEVGLGTIFGSNTFNLLFILGAVAIVAPITLKRSWVRDDLTVNIASVLLVAAAVFFPLFGDSAFYGVSRAEGVFIAVVFVLWLWHMVRRRRESSAPVDYRVFALSTSLFMIIGGLVGVFFGGNWVVSGAEALARTFDLSEGLLGVTLVGIGTSLPEFAVSLSAAWKGRTGIAIGNIVGSNIFDFLGIIGITSFIRPIPFPPELSTDIIMTAAATFLLLALLYVGRQFHISRWNGLFLIAVYCVYLAFVLTRIA